VKGQIQYHTTTYKQKVVKINAGYSLWGAGGFSCCLKALLLAV
jgi:hypothetical protein